MWHQVWPHNDLLLLRTKVQYLWHTYSWPPMPWHREAMDKEIIKAMATKFLEIFVISMLKNFVGVAWLIWMPHPLFKNRPNTYGTPCKSNWKKPSSYGDANALKWVWFGHSFHKLECFQHFFNEHDIWFCLNFSYFIFERVNSSGFWGPSDGWV